MLSTLPQRFVQLNRFEFLRAIRVHPNLFLQFQDVDRWTLSLAGTLSRASDSPTLFLTLLVSLTW